MSVLMRSVPATKYPVYLHTQPGSYREVKVYGNFGFSLITDSWVGTRRNEWEDAMPYLEAKMTPEAFRGLTFRAAAQTFIEALAGEVRPEF